MDSLSWKTIAISDLADSLTCLTIQPSTKSDATPSLPPTHQPSSQSVIPTLVIGGRRSRKKDRHRCTIKAHQLLSNIEARIHRADCLLLEPSSPHVDQMQQEVLTLQRALEGVTWNVDSVNSKKNSLEALLNDLELRMKPLSASHGPVNIDTGT